MVELFPARIGAVLSADIAVPEHEQEVRFYSRVLCTGMNPLWQADDLMNNLGIPIIGLGERTAEYDQLPLQWMPHIQVADVASSVQSAIDLKGTVLMHETAADGTSQWAVLLDPNGAAFGVIPVVPVDSVPAADAAPGPVGRIGWLDLTVADAAATRDFYQQVVGWTVENVEMKDLGEHYRDYNMLGEDGNPLAGICHSRGANTGLPPVWMIYLSVGDLTESLRRVEAEGGEVIKSVKGKGGKYVYAAIKDPVGACFALMPG